MEFKRYFILFTITCVSMTLYGQRKRVGSINQAQIHVNAGVQFYQEQNFTQAYREFTSALTYHPNDTTLLYYAGLSAVNGKDYPAAIRSYEKLVQTNFSVNNKVLLDLSKLYSITGDTAKAINIASEGAKKYKDSQLAIQEIELSLLTGKLNGIIPKIASQSRIDPSNPLLPFYLGIAYNSLGEQKLSEQSYLEAARRDPSYADAYINLGGVILNSGIKLYNDANKLPHDKEKEYYQLMELANHEFLRAYPFLQKAVLLAPQSKIALENLKTYYVVQRDRSKIDELNKSIRGIIAGKKPIIETPSIDESSRTSKGYTSSGSGFVISNNGYIVTNYHVIEEARSIDITVFYGDKKMTFSGLITAIDPENDLAILKITDSRFSSLGIFAIKARVNPIEVGENVFAMGYPKISLMGEEIKITNGIINSRAGYKDNLGTFQISAPLQSGNSGGPVFDESGDLVGISYAGIPDMQNVGYAIKMPYLTKLVSSIPENIDLLGKNSLENLKLPEKVKKLRSSIVLIKVE